MSYIDHISDNLCWKLICPYWKGSDLNSLLRTENKYSHMHCSGCCGIAICSANLSFTLRNKVLFLPGCRNVSSWQLSGGSFQGNCLDWKTVTMTKFTSSQKSIPYLMTCPHKYINSWIICLCVGEFCKAIQGQEFSELFKYLCFVCIKIIFIFYPILYPLVFTRMGSGILELKCIQVWFCFYCLTYLIHHLYLKTCFPSCF